MRSILSFCLLAFSMVFVGCADDMLTEDASQRQTASATLERGSAPRQGKLRYPQFMESAISERTDRSRAGKYGAQNAHLFVAFSEYEADGVTRRVLDSYGVTRRVLEEYGVTRRVLEEYGVTRRVLEEYGITRRVMEEYGGLTWELLEAYGVTRRILDEYGVTRRVLEEYAEAYEPDIQVRVRVNHVRPGVTIVFVADFLETFLDEIDDDVDIELVEPDVEMEGAPLFQKDGMRHPEQMLPWNVSSVGGAFTNFEKDNVDVFILDSGVWDRDLNIVEAKDFTMLFENRDEETWDDSHVIDMPFFDPGEMGDPMDRNGHGTHGAGIIGAKNNSEGVKGMAPEARIHSLKVLTDDGKTDITTVISAIDYVTDFKQQNPTQPVVANLSLGMDLESTAYNVLDEAVKRAVDFGVVVVVSAGNDYADASTYSPAHVYEAITVGAYNRLDQFAEFSNYGPAVDILAPGDAVVSLTHLESEADNDDNVVLSGTSSAAPHVAAAAALYLVQHPYASPAEVKQALINAAQARITGAPQGTTNKTVHVGFADDGTTKAFEVTKSEWDSYNKRLKLEGEGPRFDTVTLTNVGRGSTIATLVIDDEGKWKYQETEPDQIPCVAEFAYAGGTFAAETVREEVLNAPGSCDPIVEITKAEWKDDETLVIEGKAVAGTTIVLKDAQLDVEIATVITEDDRKFSYEVGNPSDVPCRVSAANTHSSAEEAVDGADEDDCSSGMGLSVPVALSKAEYDGEKKKLAVQGIASAGSAVRILSGASRNEVATVEARNDGKFTYQVTDPNIIPCDVVAVSLADGSEATRPVTKKGLTSSPGNCERSLELEEVSWNEGDQKLTLKGRGLYNNTVTFTSERTGQVFHVATIDDNGKFQEELQPVQVPCTLIVESQEAGLVSYTVAVEGAASVCERNLVFNLLQYSGVYDQLSAGGMATPGSAVTLTNPDNGTEIKSVTAAEDGVWRSDMNLSLSGAPPCRVQASAENGSALTATVSPMSGCDSNFVYAPVEEEVEQNPYSYIQLSRADFNNTARTLRVSGNGYEFMEITVTNPVTGEELGSMTNDDTPAFDFYMDIPGTIPCGIVAELDGRTAERSVGNTTDNCDDQPYLESATWNGGTLSIDGLGGAGMSATLSSSARGWFADVSFEGDGALSATFTGSDLVGIPCQVELASNGGMVSLPVNGAPENCDGTPVINLAKWANGTLMLDVDGGFRTPISVSSVGRGELVTSGSFDNKGIFNSVLDGNDLAYVPCEIAVETDGMTATRLVDSRPAACDGTPSVDLAKWNGGFFLFEAEGPFNGDFRISSTQRSETVFEAQFSNEGIVELSVSGEQGVPFMPSEILLEYRHRQGADFSSMIVPVDNVPGHADGQPVIEGAEWKNGELLVEAWGPYSGTLDVFSEADGRHLGSFTLDHLGFYDGAVTDLAFVPCSVKVVAADGLSASLPVANAPVFCDARAWLDFSKAEWSQSNQRLILQGDGYDGYGNLNSEVTFWSDGNLLHTVTTDDGEFSEVLNGLSYKPGCTIEARIAGDATTAGTEFSLAVDGVCGN